MPVIYGRPRTADANVPPSSVILAHCTDFVLAPQGAFATHPQANARELRVRRATNGKGSVAPC